MSSQTPDENGLYNDKGWKNPFAKGTPLHKLYEKRISQGRDLVMIVDDYDAGRGTGKTIGGLQLAAGMDQTDEGITREKATLNPEQLRDSYVSQPQRSALLLDEGEAGLSNRQAMSKVNQVLREIMSMGRVEEKYVIITTPLKEFIDKDLRKLADVWISMTKRGTGLVHFFEYNNYQNKLYTPKKQWIEFKDIDADHEARKVYNHLTRVKRKKMRGEDGGNFITAKEHREKLSKAKKQERQDVRDTIIKNITRHPDIEAKNQSAIGEVCLGVSQSHVSNVVTKS